jgi:hypothetical protein
MVSLQFQPIDKLEELGINRGMAKCDKVASSHANHVSLIDLFTF